MQISTTKNGRKVKLTAAEVRVLEAAKALCLELGGLLSDAEATTAGESLGKVLATYGPKPEAAPAVTPAADPKAAK